MAAYRAIVVSAFQNTLLEKRARQRDLRYVLAGPTPDATIAQAEERWAVALLEQIKRFYRQYSELRVEEPSLEVISVERMSFAAPHLLHFATVDRRYQLCFDTSRLNSAEQWDIVALPGRERITLTMASFWSNKIWAWIDKQRPIWLPEAVEQT